MMNPSIVVHLRSSCRACFFSSMFISLRVRESPWPFCNSIIRASIEKGSPQKALLDFRTIVVSGAFRPDHRTLALVLEACRFSSDMRAAMTAHARIIRSGFEAHDGVANSLFCLYLNHNNLHEAQKMFDGMQEPFRDPVLANLMISGYLRIGEFDRANAVFNQMPARDLVTWNSMIAGYVRSSRPIEAIGFFQQLLQMGFEPDGFTFSAVLSACSRVGALSHGEWSHNLMLEKGVEMNYILNAALIDMYSKCGRVEVGKKIFKIVPKVDVSIWNSMISGLAIHGLGFDALELFSRMEKEQIIPDQVTFVSLLTACSHCGLVQEGRHYFDVMQQRYSIKPLIEHYGSLVDLLARSGHLQEAYATIKAMPMEPDVVMWRTILSACRTYQQPKLGEIAIKEMSSHDSGDYVLLSNIYSLASRWHGAQRLWEVMKKKKIRKENGLSWVELGGKIHEFKAGGRSHPESEDIYQVLSGLMERAKASGFVPEIGLVVMDVLDEEKEANLSCHSEKLAVSYAVLKTSPLKEIRVSKNLRTCTDCHSWLTMVSNVLSRVIIIRDRVRFHRFESGACSCRDYW